MKKIWLIILAIVGLAVTAGIMLYFGIGRALAYFTSFNAGFFFIFLFFTILTMTLFVLRWQIILGLLKSRIPFNKLFSYKLSANSVNYIIPGFKMAGEPVRPILLKKHNVGTARAYTSLVVEKSLELVPDSSFILISSAILIFHFALPKKADAILTILSAIIMLFLILIFYYFYTGTRIVSSLLKKSGFHKLKFFKKHSTTIINIEKQTAHFFHTKKFIVLSLILMSFLIWFSVFFEYFFLIKSINVSVPLWVLFLIIFFVSMSYAVPSPASLGSLEAGQVSLFSLLGMGAALGLAVSLLIRLRDLLWTFIGLIFLYTEHIHLNKILSNSKNNKKRNNLKK
ncbi:MAG TPA: lysylphosphatidylglycerol synthase transmembrane domain-containing protein [Candidatus Nanoarchaeia archaeon]|nr:lysylphosphatidylglycerol synthase transmembrane domain-containing protein [Candidatus Nanoarchaeia archaeon]